MNPNYITWSEADIARALAAKASGRTYPDIAADMGRSADSVRRIIKLHRHKTPAAPLPPGQVESMEAAALRGKVASLEAQLARAATGVERLQVTTEAEPAHSPDELWRLAEEDNAKRIDYANKRGRFACVLPDAVAAVAFISDQHIAPGTPVDMRRMREDAELIRDTPGLYCCLGGDAVDNHIKHRSAIMAARSQPHDQYLLFEWYLEILAPKVIAMISGNHDKWTDEIGGVDMLARIAKAQRLYYAPSEAIGDVTVGETIYKIGVRHQFRMNSSYNQTHAVKQWYRMGTEDWDIGCIGHHHEAAVEMFIARGQRKWACRPGSYQITSSYSHQYGWNNAEPTCPTFILYGSGRRIIGFADVHDAVSTLAAERRFVERKAAA